MAALKRAYADVILNMAKESAARIMASEQKALRFQQDLHRTKEEAVSTLLRVKGIMDSKVRTGAMTLSFFSYPPGIPLRSRIKMTNSFIRGLLINIFPSLGLVVSWFVLFSVVTVCPHELCSLSICCPLLVSIATAYFAWRKV